MSLALSLLSFFIGRILVGLLVFDVRYIKLRDCLRCAFSEKVVPIRPIRQSQFDLQFFH